MHQGILKHQLNDNIKNNQLNEKQKNNQYVGVHTKSFLKVKTKLHNMLLHFLNFFLLFSKIVIIFIYLITNCSISQYCIGNKMSSKFNRHLVMHLIMYKIFALVNFD